MAFVAVGGAAGASLRWAIVESTGTGGSFPWWTLLVNVVGCLLLGGLWTAPERVRLGAGIGFCGGLTTFSTFTVEVALLLDRGHHSIAVGYLLASLVLGAGAFVAGRALPAR